MRLFTAFGWFFKILAKGNAAFSDAPQLTDEGKPTFTGSPEQAIQILGLLQKEGRLIDFLREDISGYQDAEVGAAVRDIHRGCRGVLDKYVVLRPVIESAENTPFTVETGFDPSTIELSGNVTGEPPYNGTVLHRGWYVDEVKLPTIAAGADPRVAAPAQVEVR
ncbi:MAG: DUF2760 domain-containing protein [Candidatus Sumerlaeia bacterium]|nr:DUF2760 domain-containing protein [Candidatus Sumerlaeia bacterium]